MSGLEIFLFIIIIVIYPLRKVKRIRLPRERNRCLWLKFAVPQGFSGTASGRKGRRFLGIYLVRLYSFIRDDLHDILDSTDLIGHDHPS